MSAQAKPKRPRDPNALAFALVAEATGEKSKTSEPMKDPAAVALSRKGGLKGGRARAEKLSPERRREIAKKAAAAGWQTTE